jgi:hypothetical protein
MVRDQVNNGHGAAGPRGKDGREGGEGAAQEREELIAGRPRGGRSREGRATGIACTTSGSGASTVGGELAPLGYSCIAGPSEVGCWSTSALEVACTHAMSLACSAQSKVRHPYKTARIASSLAWSHRTNAG